MGVLQGFATKRRDESEHQQQQLVGTNDTGDADTSSSTLLSSVPIIRRSTPLGEATSTPSASVAIDNGETESRGLAAAKHLVCGGVAGSVAKTVTAPFSRLTILFQVHSMVTAKKHRPRFAMTMGEGVQKIVERGGMRSLWKGNATSVLHRFPFSAINFFVYENALDALNGSRQREHEDEDGHPTPAKNETTKLARFVAGATAGSMACIACYPLDLVRTRLTTELEGREHYRGIVDAFKKIARTEGFAGFYSGIIPTLTVAVPSFAISYSVYGSLKEYALDDDLFYNLRKIDGKSGEETLGFVLTLMCGAASGTMSTLVTFPFDTVRRRMQIQNLHIEPEDRLSAGQQIRNIMTKEGVRGIYRGLPPELLKVVPMVGTMFLVYEQMKNMLNVRSQKP